MSKFWKDKKGDGILIFYLLLLLTMSMFVSFNFNSMLLVLERGKMFSIADEAANKAAEQIYQYATTSLSDKGQVTIDELELADNMLVDVFEEHNFTLANPRVEIDGGYLVVSGYVTSNYKQPILDGKNQDVTFRVEGRALLKRIK